MIQSPAPLPASSIVHPSLRSHPSLCRPHQPSHGPSVAQAQSHPRALTHAVPSAWKPLPGGPYRSLPDSFRSLLQVTFSSDHSMAGVANTALPLPFSPSRLSLPSLPFHPPLLIMAGIVCLLPLDVCFTEEETSGFPPLYPQAGCRRGHTWPSIKV